MTNPNRITVIHLACDDHSHDSMTHFDSHTHKKKTEIQEIINLSNAITSYTDNLECEVFFLVTPPSEYLTLHLLGSIFLLVINLLPHFLFL